ncbi:MAG: capsule biosynthesis protein [Chloroflexaceae bacterium]
MMVNVPKPLKPVFKRNKYRLQHEIASYRPFPDWHRILGADKAAWLKARTLADGPYVLIATGGGGHAAVTPLEGMLGVALTLRGARVHFLLCDQFLPACLQAMHFLWPDSATFARHGPRALCRSCYRAGYNSYAPLGLPIHRYSDFVTPEEQAEAREIARSLPIQSIKTYALDGLAIGEHAIAGALRFFATGDLNGEPHSEPIARRYLEASLLSVFAVRRLLQQYPFHSALFHHGIYVPQGIVGEVCRQAGIGVVNWVPAYRTSSFIFSHDDTYHHTLMTEPTALWEHLPWNEALENETLDYLKSRWQGTRDWIYFNERPQEDLQQIQTETGIRFDKPTIGLLTNVMWDAQLHYPANAFSNMLDWILQTISYFAKRPDLQLLMRIHPAELRGSIPSRQPILREIQRVFPVLPSNVYVIPPDSNISTYFAMLQCDSVIIYGTKTGVELTSLGIPVIVAGEAWIRGKGLTVDVQDSEQYFHILDQLPLGRRLDEVTVRRARMYAYHFFFRRMIPLRCVAKTTPSLRTAWGWWPYEIQVSQPQELLPGRDPGLDTICDGILTGSPFVYPAEVVSWPETSKPAAEAMH